MYSQVGGESGSLVQEADPVLAIFEGAFGDVFDFVPCQGTEIRRGLAAQLAELMATAQEARAKARSGSAGDLRLPARPPCSHAPPRPLSAPCGASRGAGEALKARCLLEIVQSAVSVW